ncbi:hypothetical protein RIF29_33790 [Crotalaria pallida]|uniref:Uncharacterized protein n=1 Tax=Crotalaria pallida TaxID=3830 RepID=A0AAN9HX09_CROPI
MAQEFPMWQFLLVDLRCHGDSASIKKRVALSMVDQAAKPLARARPVKVWSLDATPGKVQAGGDGEDHPGELTSFLSTLPKEVSSERYVVKALIEQGFSNDVAQGSEWAIFGRDIGS